MYQLYTFTKILGQFHRDLADCLLHQEPKSPRLQDRKYQKKKVTVEKFIKKHGTTDHSIILNNVDVNYETLMRILSELRNEGRIS